MHFREYRGYSSPILVALTNRLHARRCVTCRPTLNCYLPKPSGAGFDMRGEVVPRKGEEVHRASGGNNPVIRRPKGSWLSELTSKSYGLTAPELHGREWVWCLVRVGDGPDFLFPTGRHEGLFFLFPLLDSVRVT